MASDHLKSKQNSIKLMSECAIVRKTGKKSKEKGENKEKLATLIRPCQAVILEGGGGVA